MTVLTKEMRNAFDNQTLTRKNEILSAIDNIKITGTAYFISNDGNDNNDGLSPETAWKTPQKVSEMMTVLRFGDGVFFRRGDTFRGTVKTAAGVTYAAFGSGEKPKLYGADSALDNAELWVEVDAPHHIWKWKKKILDVGTIVFNGGEKHSYKLIPSYIGGKFVCREDENRSFDIANEMKHNLDMYWHFDEMLTTRKCRGQSFPVPDITADSFGELYLRCDEGNPSKVFESIEPIVRRHGFIVGENENVHIDNFCIRYFAQHGISAGGDCVKGLRVSNCEIGWIGGSIQHYFGTDPNYPEGLRGTVTRYGNGVELYGGCDGYTVENCYVYECYDAGMTHQVTTNGKFHSMKNVVYKNNVVENCVYSVEYFLQKNLGDTKSFMENIEIVDNILCASGYGWGQQRHNKHTPAHIKGWSYINTARDYTICGNIFDRSAYRMLHLVAEDKNSCPKMYNNTYIQHRGGMLGQYGENKKIEPEIFLMDDNADDTVNTIFGDKEAKVYVIE